MSLRLLLLAALLPPLAARAQTPVAFPDPAPEDASHAAECTSRADVTVCRKRDADGDLTYLVRRGTQTASWPIPQGPNDDFAAFAMDDGTLLVANLDGVSNGLGVSYWTVYGLPPGADAPAYRFLTEEFGPHGESFGVWRGRTVVWATEWRGGPDPAGRRPDGLYLVGRPFVVGPEALTPAAGVSVRARRFLNSFAEERARAEDAAPRAWLMDRRAETRRTDPAFAGCRRTVERGTVRTVEEARGDEDTPYLLVTLTGGRRLSYGRAGGGDEPLEIFHLGADGRLFPPGYVPADLRRRLDGRAVRVETCADEYVRTRVLWLD